MWLHRCDSLPQLSRVESIVSDGRCVVKDDAMNEVWTRIVACFMGIEGIRATEYIGSDTNAPAIGRNQLSCETCVHAESAGSARLWGARGVYDVHRRTHRSISIDWADATLGRCCDQVWNLCHARGPGVCAISGELINRGDSVYRPSKTCRAPANATSMILAKVVEEQYLFDEARNGDCSQ
ncbi:DUF3331 domain-containing protein [Paraburkholderia pallida]